MERFFYFLKMAGWWRWGDRLGEIRKAICHSSNTQRFLSDSHCLSSRGPFTATILDCGWTKHQVSSSSFPSQFHIRGNISHPTELAPISNLNIEINIPSVQAGYSTFTGPRLVLPMKSTWNENSRHTFPPPRISHTHMLPNIYKCIKELTDTHTFQSWRKDHLTPRTLNPGLHSATMAQAL
jgi:hypothetical protein